MENIFPKPNYDYPVTNLPMNTPDTPPAPLNRPVEPVIPSIDTLTAWDTKEDCRHNVRVICDLQNLTLKQKNDLSSTIHCESDYNPKCVHPNIVNGKVVSTDYGIAQINDFYHIGAGKDFPSVEFVLDNPEECVRWMAQQFKAGNAHLWVCYLKGMYESYSS